MDFRKMSGLFAPSVSLMNKLKYPTKIAILGGLVLLMSGSIIGFLLNNLQTQADFSIQENRGVEYLNPVKTLLFDLQKFRDNKTQSNFSKIKEDIQTVDSIDTKYNKALSIENKWSDIKTALSNNDINNSINQTFSLIDWITNKSNLMLDPDIDTYYLMDSFCVRFSNVIEKIYTIKNIGNNKINKKYYSQYDFIKYTSLLDEWNEIIKMNTAMITDYNSNTKDKLNTVFNDAYNANKSFINITNQLINGAKIPSSVYSSKANSAINLNKRADEQYSNELSELINIRVHKYLNQEPVSVTITVIALLILGYLAVGFYLSLVESVTKVSEELSDISHKVNSTTTILTNESETLAADNSEQAASIQETAATLEEMTSMVIQNSNNTKQATDLASKAKKAANEGSKDMVELISSMNNLKTSSNEIAKIIKVIDEIAFQTNILSLNAAVEAARAGDAGKGFAVVAEEVRNLAQRSAQAAKDTTVIIEGNIALSENSVNLTQKTSKALDEINMQVQKVNEIINEVSVATEEQSQGIGQINIAVNQMSQVTQNNVRMTMENANVVRELSENVDKMEDNIQELLNIINSTN